MNSQSDVIRGIISDWQPNTGKVSRLEKYLGDLKTKFFADPAYTVADWDDYITHFERHCGRIQNFLQEPNYFISNLVLGNVQSGKTAHMMATTAWAIDNEFDLVVLLNGNKTTLNEQTTRRVEKRPRFKCFDHRG